MSTSLNKLSPTSRKHETLQLKIFSLQPIQLKGGSLDRPGFTLQWLRSQSIVFWKDATQALTLAEYWPVYKASFTVIRLLL